VHFTQLFNQKSLFRAFDFVRVQKMQKVSFVQPQMLYVVSTPIGNLSDITERAIQVLKDVDIICCEDTRHSARLLDHLSIKKTLLSLHEHNERERSSLIIDKLKQGLSVALISDAGTPLISDPGYVLVNQVIQADLAVVPVPGVSAVITGLSVSGLPTDRFSFEGFLPHKKGARQKVLDQLKTAQRTLVFYESSHRIAESLRDMSVVFGLDRQVCVARELTKTFETLLRGSLSEVVKIVDDDANQRKGEFVVMVGGAAETQVSLDSPEVIALAQSLKPLLPPKKAAAVIVDVFGGSKKNYYELLMSL
jgi:16S rRNA (cytidine1402-2'-O)-methyltransferase